MKTLILLAALILKTFAAHAAPIDDMNKVVAEYAAEFKKEKTDYAPLQAHASQAINSIQKMSAQDAAAVIKLLQLNEATDPGRTVFDNTYSVLQKNKAALDAASKKLPKREADDLHTHIRLAIEANTKGQD